MTGVRRKSVYFDFVVNVEQVCTNGINIGHCIWRKECHDI